MNSKKPLLTPRAHGWEYDLSGPNTIPNPLYHPNKNSTPPNLMNKTLLELSRTPFQIRGLALYLGSAVALIAIYATTTILLDIHGDTLSNFEGGIFVGLTLIALGVWALIAMILGDVLRPHDEPIRFNRLRRKVYVYRFHQDWLRIFSLKAWGVRPVAYNWDDLRAEACSTYVPGTVYAKGVTLAVVKPGTNQVIDRFHFAHSHHEGEVNWAMAQLFMQQGPQALPTFIRKPRDWNNEVHTFNLARRWAPKVQWPADMDLESRTAPSEST